MDKLPERYNPDFPYPAILGGDEAMPDPAWDYYEVWSHANALKQEAAALLQDITNTEHRSQGSDQLVRDRLRQIAAQTRQIMSLLD